MLVAQGRWMDFADIKLKATEFAQELRPRLEALWDFIEEEQGLCALPKDQKRWTGIRERELQMFALFYGNLEDAPLRPQNWRVLLSLADDLTSASPRNLLVIRRWPSSLQPEDFRAALQLGMYKTVRNYGSQLRDLGPLGNLLIYAMLLCRKAECGDYDISRPPQVEVPAFVSSSLLTDTTNFAQVGEVFRLASEKILGVRLTFSTLRKAITTVLQDCPTLTINAKIFLHQRMLHSAKVAHEYYYQTDHQAASQRAQGIMQHIQNQEVNAQFQMDYRPVASLETIYSEQQELNAHWDVSLAADEEEVEGFSGPQEIPQQPQPDAHADESQQRLDTALEEAPQDMLQWLAGELLEGSEQAAFLERHQLPQSAPAPPQQHLSTAAAGPRTGEKRRRKETPLEQISPEQQAASSSDRNTRACLAVAEVLRRVQERRVEK